jgi:hypothetical protein
MFLLRATGLLAAAGLASAVPLHQRDGINDGKNRSNIPGYIPLINDDELGVILNYALTLEHLEDTFYREGLAKFSEQDFAAAGFDSSFYGNIKKVSSDESEHVGFLTGALKGVFSTWFVVMKWSLM